MATVRRHREYSPQPRRTTYPTARTTEDGRLAFPTPPTQRVSSQRIKLIRFVSIVAAVALTAYDAYVSYNGFEKLSLPGHAPLVLALLILIVQLASGAIQQLGMNPFRGVGGSDLMDWLWRWVLWGVYIIDVGSNAIEFGVSQHANQSALTVRPLDAVAMSILLIGLSALLTFGDEILLRLVDRLSIGGRANEASGRKSEIDLRAYRQYLSIYEQRAISQAQEAGNRSKVDFEWLKTVGVDE